MPRRRDARANVGIIEAAPQIVKLATGAVLDERDEPRHVGISDQQLHASASEAVTNNVRVEVESRYAPELSRPFQSQWVFHYTVKITNEGEETVQLLSRHWIIGTRSATSEEKKGSGVVGAQPVLAPGGGVQHAR